MAEGVGFEPTVRLPVRLISSQVPSTNSATLPLRSNQGREDSVNCRLVDDLVSLQNSRLRRKFYCLFGEKNFARKDSRRNNSLAPRSALQHSCILEYLSSLINRPSPSQGPVFSDRGTRSYRRACTWLGGGGPLMSDSWRRTIVRP
jgi:hypothetical protein